MVEVADDMVCIIVLPLLVRPYVRPAAWLQHQYSYSSQDFGFGILLVVLMRLCFGRQAVPHQVAARCMGVGSGCRIAKVGFPGGDVDGRVLWIGQSGSEGCPEVGCGSFCGSIGQSDDHGQDDTRNCR